MAPLAEELDRTKPFPLELAAEMGELGLMGIPFPEEYGGGDGGTLSYALCVEELPGRLLRLHHPGRPHFTRTMPIHLWAPPEQISEWLRSSAPVAGSPPSG